MKTIFHLTHLLALIFVCGTLLSQNNDKAYKTFYKEINKGFSLPKTNASTETNSKNDANCVDSLKSNIGTLESALKQLEEKMSSTRPEREVDDRPEKRYVQNPTEKDSKKAQFSAPTIVQSPTAPQPTPRLSIAAKESPKAETSTVKPQQQIQPETNKVVSFSAPAEKQSPSIATSPEQPKAIPVPVPAATTAPTTQKSTSKAINQILATKPEVRTISNDVLESGDALKKYNVVIATLSTMQRSNRLKAIFFAEVNEKIRITRSEQNLHHFIMGSFDTEEEAINKRNSLIEYYTSKYSSDRLMDKYGIPFTDIWILVKE